jgi:hypothetical protein
VHRAEAQLTRSAEALVDVAGEHASGKPERRIVGMASASSSVSKGTIDTHGVKIS